MLQVYTQKEVGNIKGHEEWPQCDDTHEHSLYAHRGGCPMHLDCCYLTARIGIYTV